MTEWEKKSFQNGLIIGKTLNGLIKREVQSNDNLSSLFSFDKHAVVDYSVYTHVFVSKPVVYTIDL